METRTKTLTYYSHIRTNILIVSSNRQETAPSNHKIYSCSGLWEGQNTKAAATHPALSQLGGPGPRFGRGLPQLTG